MSSDSGGSSSHEEEVTSLINVWFDKHDGIFSCRFTQPYRIFKNLLIFHK